ncbi:F-box protein [Actinidia chinensis var. chinensis]|uniref:F-box protein n=1 Tax=Actinidia chinensis var. chinensis TaxID=1590841 RepID=A0A2R6R204_ACTCC|nr:F-box protein [Actinidia chinensis var. chinensis]
MGRHGMTRLSKWAGTARHSYKMARHGTIKNGTARQGTVSKWARHGTARSTVGIEKKWHGTAQWARLTPLVIAVHAALLESGFVAFDSITKMKVERFYLPDEWPRSEFFVSLWYTLPEINNQGLSEDGVETVFLKFRSMGKYVNVNGFLTRNGSRVYRVCLDEDRLSFFLNIMWANCDSIKEKNGKGSFSQLHPERGGVEFWRTVKDSLALPLLIDSCEKAGLPSPPCFMRRF